MRIFAHRGLWNKKEEENTLPAIERAFQDGFDLETDIRIRGSEFVIKHDPLKEGESIPALPEVLEILKKYPDRQVAFHFKYDEWKKPVSFEIIKMLKSYLDRVFLFDMSLDYCLKFKEKNRNIKVAVSCGDKKYHDAFCDLADALNSEIDIIWADEWRNFYSKELIDQCHQAGKLVYAISPDLAGPVGHPRADKGYDKTWQDLIRWGVDGICTDHPVELRNIIKKLCR